jgi:hypothetical protein
MKKKIKDSFEEWAHSQGLMPTQALDLALVSGGTWYDIGTRGLRPLASVKRLSNLTKLEVFDFTENENKKYAEQCSKKPQALVDEKISNYLIANYYLQRQIFTLPSELRLSGRVKIEVVRQKVSQIISSTSEGGFDETVAAMMSKIEELLESGDSKALNEVLKGSAKGLMKLSELLHVLTSAEPLKEYKRLQERKKQNFLNT